MPGSQLLNELIHTAGLLGASDATALLSADVPVESDLARLCNGDPPCENYGLAASCPPHVSGPEGFQELKNQSRHSIVVRLDVPTESMFSNERREIMQLLHQIVAGVEQAAEKMGFKGSRGFAGGSCKKLFCCDYADCRQLSPKGDCRHPHEARPSMSGYGINVAKLMQSAGWNLKLTKREAAADSDSMTWVAGLIVIKEP